MVIKCLWYSLFGLRGLLGLGVFLHRGFSWSLRDDYRVAHISGSHLFQAIYDRDFTDASHLILLLRDCPPQEPLRFRERSQWKRRASIAVEVIFGVKGSLKLGDLEAGASLLVGNQFLFQHCAFRWVCFGVI